MSPLLSSPSISSGDSVHVLGMGDKDVRGAKEPKRGRVQDAKLCRYSTSSPTQHGKAVLACQEGWRLRSDSRRNEILRDKKRLKVVPS